MPGRIGFEIKLGASAEAPEHPLRRSDSMRILVLGDFSGRRNRGVEAADDLAARRVFEVDLDSFESVFRAIAPGLAIGSVPVPGAALSLSFESLEDFHPDQLYASLDAFRELRSSRQRLLDPASFDAEAERLVAAGAAGDETERSSSSAPQEAEDQARLLERLIGSPPAMPRNEAVTGRAVDGLVRALVKPHIKPGLSRSPDPYLAALDASAGELMRALLHAPDFQALEAAWRGMRRLVDSVELGQQVKLWVADVSKAELLQDLAASEGRLEDSSAYRLIVESRRRGVDDSSWSLLLGDYAFAADQDDIALLAHLGRLASSVGGPFLAAADPSLLGCEQLRADTEPRQWAFGDQAIEQRWMALRRSPVARWLGLALPRVLMRLPYGPRSDAIESFKFEEVTSATDHEAYLWGNAALACGMVLAARFLDEPAEMCASGPLDIEDLPACVRDIDGERQLLPCAEVLLPIRVGEELQLRGMIAMLSHSDRNAVRILDLRSVAEPTLALAGPE